MSMEYYLQKLIEKCNEFDIYEIPAAAGLEFDEELTLEQIYADYTFSVKKIKKQPLREGEVPVEILTAPPGGGKTALMKYCAISLAKNYFYGASGVLAGFEILVKPHLLENIFRDGGWKRHYLPVWIAPEETGDFPNMQEILQAAMTDVVPGMTLPEEGNWTYVLFVDGMEKFRKKAQRDRFFFLLREFGQEHRDAIFIMSARTDDYERLCMEMLLDAPLQPWREGIVFEEIKIPGVCENHTFSEGMISLFAMRWLKILNPRETENTKVAEAAEKAAEDLLMTGLDEFLNTPFEVTNWLLLYLQGDNLPESESAIAAREIELLLERKRSDRYHILDVKRHLARIAYAASMTSVCAPHPKMEFEEIYKTDTLEHDSLRDIIHRTDCDLGRYFEYRQDPAAEAIDEFIEYLVSTGILCRPGDGYTFSNYRYQGYLTVFCLTQNLFTREESRDPAMHIKFYCAFKKWTGSNELWRQIILSLAEQDTRRRDRVIQTMLDVARAKYWDVFPFDCLLDLTARYGAVVTEEEYREICRMLCFRPEIEDNPHRQDAEDRRKLLTEKLREIFSIIDHNGRERNEYLQKCITEGYDRCASEEERQQFSEYAGRVSEFLKSILEA